MKLSCIERNVKLACPNASVSETQFRIPHSSRSSSLPRLRDAGINGSRAAQQRVRLPGLPRDPAKCERPPLAGQNGTRRQRYACTLHRACGCSRTGRPDPQCARHSRRVRDESLSLLSLVPQDFRRFAVKLFSSPSQTSAHIGGTRTRRTDGRDSGFRPRVLQNRGRGVATSGQVASPFPRGKIREGRQKRKRWRRGSRSIDRPIDRCRCRCRRGRRENRRTRRTSSTR